MRLIAVTFFLLIVTSHKQTNVTGSSSGITIYCVHVLMWFDRVFDMSCVQGGPKKVSHYHESSLNCIKILPLRLDFSLASTITRI